MYSSKALVRIVDICRRGSRHHKISFGIRTLTTETTLPLRRSYLYVPCSSERKLQKSLQIKSDVLIYDLEDSISPAPEAKAAARLRLKGFLLDNAKGLESLHIAVRVNDLTTPFFQDDISEIVAQCAIQTLVMPKIHSVHDLERVSGTILSHRPAGFSPLQLVSTIESARAILNLNSIAAWKSGFGPAGGVLSAILFGAEDYCADTSAIRTHTRKELLYARSKLVIAAKAFGLDAIDMVCVDYKDVDVLKSECLDGRQLGFNGKQAIHPSQISTINTAFVPTRTEIMFAARVLKAMKEAQSVSQGAVGLDGKMLDAPMIKQARKIIAMAEAANLEIP